MTYANQKYDSHGQPILRCYELSITRADGSVTVEGYQYLDQIGWYRWDMLKADPAVVALKVREWGRKDVYGFSWEREAVVERGAA